MPAINSSSKHTILPSHFGNTNRRNSLVSGFEVRNDLQINALTNSTNFLENSYEYSTLKNFSTSETINNSQHFSKNGKFYKFIHE
jgi:hypothetical protein